ncbi:hypothetical protein N9406_12500 [Verrucomicrobiales bacterium]|nr:hypothetical protein [Verrucomicrobiales bacterium]
MKAHFIILLLTFMYSGHSLSQNQTITNRSFFAPTTGETWTQAGELIRSQGAVSG